MRALSFLPFKTITLFFLYALAFGMPLGKIFMSITTIGLAATWLLEGQFFEKYKKLKRLKFSPVILSGLFFIPLFWLLNTSNYSYAFRQIELSLPLLAFPVILGTTQHINQKVFKQTLVLFLLGVILSTLISFLIYINILPTEKDISNVRNISIFMSHIRLSLFICLAIVIGVYFFLKENGLTKWAAFIAVIWLTLFVIILKAGTAWVILTLILFFFPIYLSFKYRKLWYSFISIIIAALISLGIWKSYSDYYYINPKEFEPLEEYTEGGEKYHHDINSTITENGFYIFRNIAKEETSRAWNTRSKISFDSTDRRGQPVIATLYRYLTSKGLKKDSVSVFSLTEKDIIKIENGITSAVHQNAIESRLYETFYDIDLIKSNKLEQGHTLAQRVAYLTVGWEIAKNNFWFGTGTGDVRKAYEEQYQNLFSDYDKKNQLKALNQFLSIMIAYGFIGLVLWITLWTYPMIRLKYKHPIYFFFVIIIVVSFFSDNTLHRQAGITMFAFFNSLLLFYPANKK